MKILEDLGLEPAIVVAGVVGSVVSLSMIRNLSLTGAMGTILGGTACAAYLTPLVVEYTKLTGASEHALAFFLGVCGMNAVAGLFKVSEKFKADPVGAIGAIRKGELPKDDT